MKTYSIFPHASTSRNLLAACLFVFAVIGSGPAYAGDSHAGDLATSPDNSVLSLDVREALLMALQNNSTFRVERVRPAIMQTYERQERAAFDPVLSADVYAVDDDSGVRKYGDNDSVGAGVNLRNVLPTGTALDAGLSRNPASWASPSTTDYAFQITQPLLRGLGSGPNLARLRMARLDTRMSVFEMRAVAEALLTAVENVYWDYILAERSIEIYRKSMEIAEQQVVETRTRISIGLTAETELAAVEAERAGREERLIDARSALSKARIALLRLLNPEGVNPFEVNLHMTESPEPLPGVSIVEIQQYVATGLQQRADLNQAMLSIDKGEIELVRTRNGVLPKLDLFIRLGGSRYADSFNDYERGEWNHEARVGIAMEWPLGGRQDRAVHDRSILNLEQAEEALANMRQLAEAEIRTAHIEVGRAQAQVNATQATLRLREETLQTEIEKFRIGKSTSLLVAQASRDLVESEIGRTAAIIAYRKALLHLTAYEGTLLARWDISLE